jgi:threonyl-tRNA synthetase
MSASVLAWSGELNEGDGAFYAPKLDFVVKDAIGRDWQCGTIQVDMNLPTRLDMHYIGEDGEKHRPHMVHRAIFGSIERFFGILCEHYAGKFPLWLAPVQAVVCSITNDQDAYALQVAEALRAQGLRVETDLSANKINYKVREHSLQKIPYILAVGGRDLEANTVALRELGKEGQETLALADAIAKLASLAAMPS